MLRPPRTKQDGFSLIELVIVMVILAIILAIAVPHFLGAKKTSFKREAAAAGATYRNAVTAYQRQNMGRAPKGPGSADWPDTKGPKNFVDPTDPSYLSNGVPAAVARGDVAVLAGAAGAPPPPAKAAVFYRPDVNVVGGYFLVVTAADGSVICDGSTTPDPSAGVARC